MSVRVVLVRAVSLRLGGKLVVTDGIYAFNTDACILGAYSHLKCMAFNVPEKNTILFFY